MGGLECWSSGVWECWILSHQTITPSRQYSNDEFSCLPGFRCFDVFDFHVEIQRLSRQRMIEVDDNGFFFDFVDADWNRSPVGPLGHQRYASLLRLGGNRFARQLLKRLLVRHAV